MTTKIGNFDQKLYSLSKIDILVKSQILCQKSKFCQKSDALSEIDILVKNQILCWKSDSLLKIVILVKNRILCQKIGFFVKNRNVGQKSDSLSKIVILVVILTKQIYYRGIKFWTLLKVTTTRQPSLWQKHITPRATPPTAPVARSTRQPTLFANSPVPTYAPVPIATPKPIDIEKLKMEIAEFAQLAAEQSAQAVESKVKLRYDID